MQGATANLGESVGSWKSSYLALLYKEECHKQGNSIIIIAKVKVIITCTMMVLSFSCINNHKGETSEVTGFTGESSSSSRGFITKWFTENGTEDCSESDMDSSLEEAFFLPDFSPPHVPLCSLDSPLDVPYV